LRKYINYIIIIVLIVAGIGSCGYASTKTGNSGWDGILPALLGLCFFAAGAIYLVVSLISYFFVKRELKSENIELDNDHKATSQHRKDKLLKLLGVSLAAYSVNLIVLFGLTKQFGSMDYLAAILPAAIIIVSYLCLLNELKFARTIWITVLIYLLISSISFLIVSAGKSSYNIFCIGIPIAYLYTISILVRSRVVNKKNTD
jgi:hypothetical protein